MPAGGRKTNKLLSKTLYPDIPPTGLLLQLRREGAQSAQQLFKISSQTGITTKGKQHAFGNHLQ